MAAKLITLCFCASLVDGLRTPRKGSLGRAQKQPGTDNLQPSRYRLMKASELVPNCLVGSLANLNAQGPASDLPECLSTCEKLPNCIGILFGAEDSSPCSLRGLPINARNGTCLEELRRDASFEGFDDVPLVPVAESDGAVYMRDDCMDSSVRSHGNAYYGVPWDWQQPGLSLRSERGYGVSPLLDLVTPSVLDGAIVQGHPPWRVQGTGGPPPLDIDVKCTEASNVSEIRSALRSSTVGRDGAALLADVGACICPLLNSGWDPAKELRTDIVLLLHRDINFSPAPPFNEGSWYTRWKTRPPCVNMSRSTFKSDVEAFTALVDNPRVLGIYFVQTPPIAHEKVWMVPLGISSAKLLARHYRGHLTPDSPLRVRTRTALYDVTHNLGVHYRRAVHKIVQQNFGDEPLPLRYLRGSSRSRMEDIVLEPFEAVFGQSPPGIGENCYRHFELLLAGAIPVVQASLGIAGLRYFPHLAVSDWHKVTPELLRGSYTKIWDRVRKGEFSLEPLTVGFWHKHILDIANRRKLPPFYAKFPMPDVTCVSWDCTKPPL
mmetsp:Transcript_34780/g.108186  ORF Transcript_34780/g.108186 Transcript_34780/m.108186 type:complete len:548 (-) Transcript_34780:72-1715(-)